MLLPRLQPPLRAVVAAARSTSQATSTSSTQLAERFANLHVSKAQGLGGLMFVRHAHHASQGVANGVKDGPGKRLGAKKTGEEYVIPGNIIFRQRGTKWFPGENCAMGRDHTIYSTQKGYVKYYKDPARHPDRKYIGVVFERDDVLPRPAHQPRRRRLGMVSAKIEDVVEAEEEAAPSTEEAKPDGIHFKTTDQNGLIYDVKLRQGYMYREANWEIGRVVERNSDHEKVRGVKPFIPGNRWLAWRKRSKRIAANAERKVVVRKGAGNNKGAKSKAKGKARR